MIFCTGTGGAVPSGTNPDGNAPFGTAPPWALHRRARTLMGTHPSAQHPLGHCTVGHEPLRERTLRDSPIIHQSIIIHLTMLLTPYICICGRRQANSGPKANCGKPHTPYTYMGGGKPTAARRPTAASHTHPMYVYICMHTSHHHPLTHAINHHNPFIAHCSGSMLSLVWVRILSQKVLSLMCVRYNL